MATATTTRGNSNKNTKRKSIPGAAAPTSPVAMGKALVVLATSCAAWSSHPVPTTRRGGCVASRARPHRDRHQCMMKRDRLHRGGNGESHSSALRYRDGDEDQPVALRGATRSAVDAAAAGTKAKAGVPSPNHGRSSPHFNILTFAMPSVSIPRMPSSRAPSKEEQEQLVMDEYLEYVERRYRSMHPGHHQRRQPRKHQSTPRRVALDHRLPRKIFLLSKLSSHRAMPSTAAPTAAAVTTRQEALAQPGQEPLEEEEEEEGDPLNILGLSNLASERLRQRLHVPRHSRNEATLLALSREGAAKFVTYCVNTGRPMFVPSGLPPRSSKAASKARPHATADEAAPANGGRASAYVALSFPAQLRLLLVTLRCLALATARAAGILAAFAGRACEEILDRGGFRGMVRLAGAAGVAVLIVFRPLFPETLRQG